MKQSFGSQDAPAPGEDRTGNHGQDASVHGAFRSAGHGSLARVGVAVCHGFTGSPISMRAWSEHLADEGFAVNMPLLAGHGTSWQELSKTPWEHWYRDFEAAYLELAGRCDTVFVAGMSMGGALALRVAALHPVAGLALVNPGLTFDDPRARYSGLLKHVLKSVPAIGDDIKAPGISEGAYTRTPVAAVHELSQLFADTISLLPRVSAPALVFRSTVDHVVPDSSIDILHERIGSRNVQLVPLENSYHVATMDNDAPLIFSESAAFFQRNLHAI
ncbi:carboxylesterase [Arthrobacter stackebrandtii]|uniref:Carboxylesterase n=1 Tax=Arthrobacter stackebrandtii TaxID=272161 RepID=A0ABS4Z1S6_9MICC|nr:alpha/beta fold hydrolase [Arthrobacter stackebrandtii]MBP2414997.1 carboxylesterase [Arthrobacter stackebrandtii]PYH00849.1 esterase [Arthrobacter stackebrandtii]